MVKIKQIGLVSAVCIEIANQHHGIKLSQKQLAVIVSAADSVCAAFNEPDMCDNCNDKLRGGCLPTCNQYRGR
ncbi:TPA: hypothetical protein ACKRHO_002301 [Morganella morganii]